MENCKRKVAVIITIVIGISLLTACGKEGKDDIANDIADIGVETDTDNKADVGVPDHLDYVVSNSETGTSIRVSAQVDSKGATSATVYEVQRKEVDEAFIKQIAEGLFGENYSYVKPYGHCSFEELEHEKQVYDAIYNGAKGENGSYYVGDMFSMYRGKVEQLLADYQGSGASLVEHSGLLYHQDEWNGDMAYNIGETYTEQGYAVTAADYSRIRGEMDNHTYEIYYEKYYVEFVQTSDNTFEARYNPARLMIRPMDTPYVEAKTIVMDNVLVPNQCDYDTALKQAQDVMDRIGLKDWTVAGAEQLYVFPSDDRVTSTLNGYAIWFSIQPDDIGLYSYGGYVMASGTEHDSEWMYATGQPYVRITVTDAGVLNIDIGDVYSEVVPSKKKVELMPFEQINEIAKSELKGCFFDGDINQVMLKYAYVSYDGINFSIVPVWAYYISDEPNEYYNNPSEPFICINALDGQIVEGYQGKMIRCCHLENMQFWTLYIH